MIRDNYATHKYADVQQWLAKHKRFHLHFTPTSSSWLNLVERWFRELTDKALRRGVFHSVPDLVTKIQEYLDAHNDQPKPFVWTAKARGHPGQGAARSRRPPSSQSKLRHCTRCPSPAAAAHHGYRAGANPGIFCPSQCSVCGKRSTHTLIRWPALVRTSAVTDRGGRAMRSSSLVVP